MKIPVPSNSDLTRHKIWLRRSTLFTSSRNNANLSIILTGIPYKKIIWWFNRDRVKRDSYKKGQ